MIIIHKEMTQKLNSHTRNMFKTIGRQIMQLLKLQNSANDKKKFLCLKKSLHPIEKQKKSTITIQQIQPNSIVT